MSTVPLIICPLTPDLWSALEDLFCERVACIGCWCMYWRIGAAYRARPSAMNRDAFRDVVAQGPPPGLLAFSEGVPVGWCQLTPRNALPHLERYWRLRRVDDLPVWSISCFYIRKDYRKRGVTAALISEALKVAKRAGAPALEAYPYDAAVSTSSSFTGYASTFLRAGFKVVAQHVPYQPILRHDLRNVLI